MTPETRQTMLFSATMPAAIVSLARTHMRHPMNIRAESSYENTTVPATAQFIYLAHDLDKPEIIGRVLQAEDAGKIIVFTRTKRQAQRVADDLAERGFSASPLHGDMAQVAREKALTKFREDKIRVLVATDVAARGIDVAGVSHVINYTCPEDDKTYVHRIGRTGRAGATGIAITFVDWADLHRWKMINKTLDLPFDEPQETYSTSEHLYHDQGIAPGTKGRIVDPAPVERKPREDRDRGDRGGDRNRGERSDRPRPQPDPHPPRRRPPPPAAPPLPRPTEGGDARAPVPSPQPQPQPSAPLRRLGQQLRGRVHHRLTCLTPERPASAGRRAARQAVTTTVVPIGAKSHSAIASGALLADAAVRLRRAELGDRLHLLAVVDRDVVEADRGVVALGEPDEVLHRPGVVDAVGLLGAGVDGVGAGVEVVVEAAGDQVGPLRPSRRSHQPDPLPALAEDDPLAGARPGRQGRVDGSDRRSTPHCPRTSLLSSEVGLVSWLVVSLGDLTDRGRGRRLRPGRHRHPRPKAEHPHLPSTAMTGHGERGAERAQPAVARADLGSVLASLRAAFFRAFDFGRFARITRFAATSR